MDWTHVAMSKGIAELQAEINHLNLELTLQSQRHHRELTRKQEDLEHAQNTAKSISNEFFSTMFEAVNHLSNDFRKFIDDEEPQRAMDIKYSIKVMEYYLNKNTKSAISLTEAIDDYLS